MHYYLTLPSGLNRLTLLVPDVERPALDGPAVQAAAASEVVFTFHLPARTPAKQHLRLYRESDEKSDGSLSPRAWLREMSDLDRF